MMGHSDHKMPMGDMPMGDMPMCSVSRKHTTVLSKGDAGIIETHESDEHALEQSSRRCLRSFLKLAHSRLDDNGYILVCHTQFPS